jgi:hypothetical protein
MKLSENFTKIFETMLLEFAQSNLSWNKDPKAHIESNKKNNSSVKFISAPNDMEQEIQKECDNKPRIYQLHYTLQSFNFVKELSIIIHEENDLKCLPYELEPIIEDIAYDYVNNDVDGFIDRALCIKLSHAIKIELLEDICIRRITNFKEKFTKSIFQFPVTMFNLNKELKLTKNIRLVPIESSDLSENEKSIYKCTRPFDYNYYLEIHVQTYCSHKLALQLAEKARDATYNILKLLATRLSKRAIPLLASNEKNYHLFDFYRHGIDRDTLGNATTRSFPSFQFDSAYFWESFDKARKIDETLIDTSFKIADLLLVPYFKENRSLENMERSLMWYGDSVSEQNYIFQIQKIVTSLEALVNCNQKNKVTKRFIRRVTHLNIIKTGIDEEIRKKADELYTIRSEIIHGASINKKLSFCAVELCSATLLGAIYYYNDFGFEQINIDDSLPKFLDEIPKNYISL